MSLRVFELAKELNTPTKELIERIGRLGIKIQGNFSVLEDDQILKIKTDFLEPASRIKESIVSGAEGTKRVRRRIISAKKAATGKRIRKSLNIADESPQKVLPVRDEAEDAESPGKPEAGSVSGKEEIETATARRKAAKEPVQDEERETAKNRKGAAKRTIKEKRKSREPDPGKAAESTAVERGREDAAKISAAEDAGTPLAGRKRSKTEKTKVLEKAEPRKGASRKPGEKEPADREATEKTKKGSRKKQVSKPQSVPDPEITDELTAKKKKERVFGKAKKKERFVMEGYESFKDEEPSAFAGKRKFKKFRRKGGKTPSAKPERAKHVFNPRKKDLVVGELITVGDLAKLIGIRVPEIIKTLMSLDIMATITQSIDGETAALVAEEHNIEVKVDNSSIEDTFNLEQDDAENLVERPPVVTIMGHVDHGKTKLLDTIRSANVVDGEAGGITQHIGAYHVDTKEGKVTFLDTPGHAAFTAMRARGANVTDIVVLVVAADDGLQPQTVEAIHHAKAANVSIIVAINKCDKPEANPDRVVQQLLEHELVAEELGGNIPMIQLSAKTGEGIPKLMEMTHLQAEMMELRADPNRLSQGVVIESRLDKGRGNVATVLIQTGTLRVGDNCVVGTEYGKIRAMWNDRGKKVAEATPAMPVEIVGLSGMPKAGDKLNVGKDEKQIRQISYLRTEKEKEQRQVVRPKKTLENLFDSVGKEEKSTLSLIIKADVIGSAEAIADSLSTLGNEEVSVKIVHSAVGGISSTDVSLASASNAIVLGFNTRPDSTAKRLAKEDNIEIRLYSVIYEAIDDVKKALEGMLKPIVREELQGRAKVLDVFNIPKVGFIAGSKVVEGKIVRNTPIRVLRDNVVIHNGRLSSLKRFKDDAKEVMTGFECGIGIEAYKDIRIGDEIESYSRTETTAKL